MVKLYTVLIICLMMSGIVHKLLVGLTLPSRLGVDSTKFSHVCVRFLGSATQVKNINRTQAPIHNTPEVEYRDE